MNDFTDISAVEAKATLQGALDSGEFRAARFGDSDVVEIKYGDRWLMVGRCDEADQVRSTYDQRGKTAEEMLQFWLGAIWLGARLTSDWFNCIDSRTDG